MKDRPRTQDWDWPLFGIIGAISTLGVLEVYSSTHASPMAGMQWKQLMWIGIGLIGMFLISRIDYHTLMDQAPVLYMFGLATLLVVLVIGHSRFGAKRWVALGGGVNLQVSELMKLIIIVVLARFFTDVRTDRLTLQDIFKVGVVTGIPVVLILIQPDLGTAMVLVPVAVVGAFLAGIEWKHQLVALALIAAFDSGGLAHADASEAVPAAADYDFPASGRESAGGGLPDPAVGDCGRLRGILGQRDLARAVRISWGLCRCGIRTLFWRRWRKSRDLSEFAWFCCCTWA